MPVYFYIKKFVMIVTEREVATLSKLTIKPTGDCALCVTFPGEISVENNLKVRTLQLALEEENLTGVVELVPAYCSLMIHYDPLKISYDELEQAVHRLAEQSGKSQVPAGTVMQIPVLYGDEWGPDLEEVAQLEEITPEEVIARHSSQVGFIYMIAFTPGLPYIGSTEKTFSVPRRSSPREKLPAGSVTIWESQTTVFPVEQPGGWNVIGRTPLKLFDKDNAESPFLLKAGNWIEFIPIDRQTYDTIEKQVQSGTYKPVVYEKENCNGN